MIYLLQRGDSSKHRWKWAPQKLNSNIRVGTKLICFDFSLGSSVFHVNLDGMRLGTNVLMDSHDYLHRFWFFLPHRWRLCWNKLSILIAISQSIGWSAHCFQIICDHSNFYMQHIWVSFWRWYLHWECTHQLAAINHFTSSGQETWMHSSRLSKIGDEI